jgi:hypothetical protein
MLVWRAGAPNGARQAPSLGGPGKIHLFDVQEQLGHHSPAFTLGVYGHLLPRGDRRAVDRLDDTTVRNPDATADQQTVALSHDSGPAPLESPVSNSRH